MSYCRIDDDSDVYVTNTPYGFQIIFRGGNSALLDSRRSCRDTLMLVSECGIKVPARAIDRLEREMEVAR